jgi:hypothetical protein
MTAIYAFASKSNKLAFIASDNIEMQLGGFPPFLQKYLQEYLTIGYSDAPMEQEADRIADEICI